MIGQISGTVQGVSENILTVGVSGISYEVYIPTAVMKTLDTKFVKNSQISLVTYHYYQTDPSKSIPILIGFANKMEKEFFEKFITVSGVGPKAAVKALSQPIQDIAEAIDNGNLPFLKSLPGIGEQRAKEIIAKLQGKMARFGLMKKEGGQAKPGAALSEAHSDGARQEAEEILLQLQYRREEARQMIQKAFTRNPKLAAAEEILNEVYRQQKNPSK